MRYKFGLPHYLENILSDYLKNQFIIYETGYGRLNREFTSGTAQSKMPEGDAFIGYTDDITVAIRAKTSMMSKCD